MLRRFALTTAVLAIAGTAAFAQMPPQPPPVANPLGQLGQGSEQERAACHPDVMKFCRRFIKDNDDSDVFAILDCLQTNRTKISVGCQQVLASHGQ
jgi:hypothetical protein